MPTYEEGNDPFAAVRRAQQAHQDRVASDPDYARRTAEDTRYLTEPSGDPYSYEWDPDTFLPRGLKGFPQGRLEAILAFQYRAEELAKESQNRYFNAAQDYLSQGGELFERYRPGGAASLSAGLYQGQAQLSYNIGAQQQAPDLLANYRLQQENRMVAAQKRAAKMQLALGIIQSGAAVAAAAAGAPVIPPMGGFGGTYNAQQGGAPQPQGGAPAGPSGPQGARLGGGGQPPLQAGVYDILGTGSSMLGPGTSENQMSFPGTSPAVIQRQPQQGGYAPPGGAGGPGTPPGGPGGPQQQQRGRGGPGGAPGGGGLPAQAPPSVPFGADGDFSSQGNAMKQSMANPMASVLTNRLMMATINPRSWDILEVGVEQALERAVVLAAV